MDGDLFFPPKPLANFILLPDLPVVQPAIHLPVVQPAIPQPDTPVRLNKLTDIIAFFA